MKVVDLLKNPPTGDVKFPSADCHSTLIETFFTDSSESPSVSEGVVATHNWLGPT